MKDLVMHVDGKIVRPSVLSSFFSPFSSFRFFGSCRSKDFFVIYLHHISISMEISWLRRALPLIQRKQAVVNRSPTALQNIKNEWIRLMSIRLLLDVSLVFSFAFTIFIFVYIIL